MNSIAVVTSTNKKYLPATNALINGLGSYGNFVDLHLIVTPDVPESYLNRLPAWVIVHPFSDYVSELTYVQDDTERGLPWQVRFLSYVQAAMCCNNYEAVQIMDSDCFVVDSIMPTLFDALNDGVPYLIENPFNKYMLGTTDLSKITKACHPPYHCHGAIFLAKHKYLLERVFFKGLEVPYGDMVCLHCVLMEAPDVYASIKPMQNKLWCMTEFWEYEIETHTDCVPRLFLNVSHFPVPVHIVHGRWYDMAVCEKELMNPMCLDRDRAVQNMFIFHTLYEWFNTHGAMKLLPEEQEG